MSFAELDLGFPEVEEEIMPVNGYALASQQSLPDYEIQNYDPIETHLKLAENATGLTADEIRDLFKLRRIPLAQLHENYPLCVIRIYAHKQYALTPLELEHGLKLLDLDIHPLLPAYSLAIAINTIIAKSGDHQIDPLELEKAQKDYELLSKTLNNIRDSRDLKLAAEQRLAAETPVRAPIPVAVTIATYQFIINMIRQKAEPATDPVVKILNEYGITNPEIIEKCQVLWPQVADDADLQASLLEFASRAPKAFLFAIKISATAQFFYCNNVNNGPDYAAQRQRLIERSQNRKAVEIIEHYHLGWSILYSLSRQGEWDNLLEFIKLDKKIKDKIGNIIDRGKTTNAEIIISPAKRKNLKILIELIKNEPDLVIVVEQRNLPAKLLHDPEWAAERKTLKTFMGTKAYFIATTHAVSGNKPDILYAPSQKATRDGLAKFAKCEIFRKTPGFAPKYLALTEAERIIITQFATTHPKFFTAVRNAQTTSLLSFARNLPPQVKENADLLKQAVNNLARITGMNSGKTIHDIFTAIALLHDLDRFNSASPKLYIDGRTARVTIAEQQVYHGEYCYNTLAAALFPIDRSKIIQQSQKPLSKDNFSMLPPIKVDGRHAKAKAEAERRQILSTGRLITSTLEISHPTGSFELKMVQLQHGGKILATEYTPTNIFAQLAESQAPKQSRAR